MWNGIIDNSTMDAYEKIAQAKLPVMIFGVDIDQSMEEFLGFLYSIMADRRYTDTNDETIILPSHYPLIRMRYLVRWQNTSSVFILGSPVADATTLTVVPATNWYRPRTHNNNTIRQVVTDPLDLIGLTGVKRACTADCAR